MFIASDSPRILLPLAAGLAAALASGCVVVEEERASVDLKSFTFDRVFIEGSSGSIDVTVGDRPGVDATLRFSGGHRPEMIAKVEGGELYISYDCKPLARVCSADLEVELPADIDLRMDASSGSISAVGILGDVDAKASSGAVDLAEIGGDVSVDASSGSVSVRAVDGGAWVEASSGGVDVTDVLGEVYVKAQSGGVTLDAVAGPIEVDSNSGSVVGTHLTSDDAYVELSSGRADLSFDARPHRVEVDSSSGSIDIAVPTGAYRVDAHTSSGQVTVSGLVQDDSADAAIVADASSGDIDIRGR